jgi:uncharacterized protein (TIGR00255 family)
MLYSMTGFGSLEVTIVHPNGERSHIALTLKSLNSRFFEASCRLPSALQYLESDIVKKCKTKLMRGSIFFTLHVLNQGLIKGAVIPNKNHIEGYLSAIKAIQQEYCVPGEITIKNLISLPQVFESYDQPLSDAIIQAIMKGVDDLLEQVVQSRQVEGAKLYQDIAARVVVIREALQIIEPRSHELIAQKRASVIENFKALLSQINQEHLAEQTGSLFNQLERMDIHEELVRFKSHLETIDSVLTDQGHEKGKKLDFTLQELFRETNTLTVKCADSVIGRLGITLKVELEKAREQVQNIV